MDKDISIKIDSRVEKLIRSFKQEDHILHFIGIDNLILSTVKIQNSIHENKDDYIETMLNSILPTNLTINGFLLIYNDNLYDDIDEAIELNIKILHEKYSSIISNKLSILVIKDVLYIDNGAKLEFEQMISYNTMIKPKKK